MLAQRKFITLLALFIVFAYVQVTEARPRMRHHRGDSGCSRCAPGWGVVGHCTPERDTQCSKCPKDTYSPHHNMQPCWICSRCGPGLYEAHPCVNGRTDTVCDSCHRVAHDNPDYQRKCKNVKSLFLAPEDALNTGEESSLVNERQTAEIDETERENILEDDAEAQLLDGEKSETMFPLHVRVQKIRN